MGLKPLHDRVIVKRKEKEDKTAGGIYIPDSAKEKPQNGVVMAAGPECKTVKDGDIILFAKYAGSEFTMDSDELIIMREDDILGVFA
ncbi:MULTISPECIES: co-chaperone GroES [unclassified Pseudodesulfovibrio]|uniref:co-chaperone GroES n=1 Tax=unclassified Pseudodesulfovibrio TaxID=2661612 RepID=UPI000FEB74E0|nr:MULTISPECIES: co-chaperone GroES [unclassified Pseudodesulfovibrio]MCJ2164345.1 co-chaperone GroES [Pseudodesulfovibrio sp. S3-i]RWU04555.1 co-chaperone GroES [Pseudodesulfovibrio sp. S3]